MTSENNTISVKKKTFFKCIKHHFPDVDETKIETELFLEASKEVVELIIRLGKVFAPVKYDMNNNIDKIYSAYEKDKIKNKYLHDLILHEKEQNENLATSGLQWLRRALHFILRFFECIIESHKDDTKPENLEKLLNVAYAETLMPYHRWLSQQLFNILCKMSLTRTQFFEILANSKNVDDEVIICDMESFNVNLRKCILDVSSFYLNNQLENVDRV